MRKIREAAIAWGIGVVLSLTMISPLANADAAPAAGPSPTAGPAVGNTGAGAAKSYEEARAGSLDELDKKFVGARSLLEGLIGKKLKLFGRKKALAVGGVHEEEAGSDRKISIEYLAKAMEQRATQEIYKRIQRSPKDIMLHLGIKKR